MSSNAVLCQRCQLYEYTPYNEPRGPGDPFPPALSRLSRGGVGSGLAPIYVCSACGQDEAMLEYVGKPLQTPDSWPVKIEFTFPSPHMEG